MLTIQSEEVTIQASSEAVFEKLIVPANIESLLPEGKYSEWKADETSCSFKLQGMYTVALEMIGKMPSSEIVWKSADGSAIPFHLKLQLQENNGISIAQLNCEADVNAFMEMMVKGPLKALFDSMARKL
ncbi:MAG: hypothetical protein ACKO6L_00815, partial [Flavobacteriales bacterium]